MPESKSRPLTQEAKDREICVCGHIRRAHYNSSGKCDEISGVLSSASFASWGLTQQCPCSRFKCAKTKT